MDSAARKRKSSSSEESEASASSILTVTKTRRRLEDSLNSAVSDRLSSSSCCLSTDDELFSSKYAHLEKGENENGVTVGFTGGTSPADSSNCSERSEKKSEADGEVESSMQLVEKIVPSEAELEEFFAAAERAIQKKFIDKYNFDIVKDEPLEGRYEWVRLQLKP